MGFLRRIAGLLGLSREEEEEESAAEAHHSRVGGAGEDEASGRTGAGPAPRGATRGFSVQVPVAVERPSRPVLVPCDPGEGGVQGFRWYTRKLRIDEDGDVADEFLGEATAEMLPSQNHQINPPRFQVKYNTRPTAMAMRNQTIVADGNVRQSLEYQGRLQWV